MYTTMLNLQYSLTYKVGMAQRILGTKPIGHGRYSGECRRISLNEDLQPENKYGHADN